MLTMPIWNLDKATNLDKDTKGVVRDQTMEHADSNMGVWDKHRGDNMSNHGEAYNVVNLMTTRDG